MSGAYFPSFHRFLGTGNADDKQNEAHGFGGKSHNGACPVKLRCLRLNFLGNIVCPVFTGIPFEKQGISLRIALVDAANDNVVNHGPEASAVVEIVLISKDFNCTEENWTTEQFNSRIVKGADGREMEKSLLCGKLWLPLKEGIASVSEIFFRHTRQHMKKNEFRLGARIVDYSSNTRVREAKTEPFTVKDRRIMSKKHYPPSLDDEVWRLKKIGKDGPYHRRLRERNIRTVKDFLKEFNKEPKSLCNILGMAKTSKMWEATVEHAQTCILDTTKYLYWCPQPIMGVVFNVVGQVLGLYSESQFVPIDQLSDTQKAHARASVACAYERWDEVVNFDVNAYLLPVNSLLPSIQNPSYSGNTSIHGGCGVGTSYAVESNEQVEFSPYILSPAHLACCQSALDSPLYFDPETHLGGSEMATSENFLHSINESDSISKIGCLNPSKITQGIVSRRNFKWVWRKTGCLLKWLAIKRIVSSCRKHVN